MAGEGEPASEQKERSHDLGEGTQGPPREFSDASGELHALLESSPGSQSARESPAMTQEEFNAVTRRTS